MPRYFVRQPNGLLAEFSTIVDHFTVVDMTEAEAYEHARIHMGIEDAKAKVKRGVEDQPLCGGSPGSGHDRWDNSLQTLVMVHKQDGLEKFKAEYPGVFTPPAPAVPGGEGEEATRTSDGPCHGA